MAKKDKSLYIESSKDLITATKKQQIGTIRFGFDALGKTFIPTGHMLLDFYLLGGIPENGISSISGIEGSFKTIIALHLTAEAQKKYPKSNVLWIDAELCFDKDWAVAHGVDLDRIIVQEPDCGEDAVNLIQKAILTMDICLVIVDSLQALITELEDDSSAFDMIMSPFAKIQTRLIIKANKSFSRRRQLEGNPCTLLLLSQMRKNLSMSGGAHKAEYKNPSAMAVNHFKQTDILLRKKKPAQKDSSTSGKAIGESSFILEKAKFGIENKGSFTISVCLEEQEDMPYKIGEFTDYEAQVFSKAKEENLIEGIATLTTTGECFRSGDACKKFLRENETERLNLASLVIQQERRRRGLPEIPVDGYLLLPQEKTKNVKREKVRERKKVQSPEA